MQLSQIYQYLFIYLFQHFAITINVRNTFFGIIRIFVSLANLCVRNDISLLSCDCISQNIRPSIFFIGDNVSLPMILSHFPYLFCFSIVGLSYLFTFVVYESFFLKYIVAINPMLVYS